MLAVDASVRPTEGALAVVVDSHWGHLSLILGAIMNSTDP